MRHDKIKLVAKDGVEVPAYTEEVMRIPVLAPIVDVEPGLPLPVRIPVPMVDSQNLMTVLSWIRGNQLGVLQHTQGLRGEQLFELMNAADFLALPDMLEDLCRQLADRIRGQSADNIIMLLGLEEVVIAGGQSEEQRRLRVQEQHLQAFKD